MCWRQSRQKNGKGSIARKRDMRHKRNARKAAKTMALIYQHVHGNVLTLCKKQVHTIIVAFRKRAHRPILHLLLSVNSKIWIILNQQTYASCIMTPFLSWWSRKSLHLWGKEAGETPSLKKLKLFFQTRVFDVFNEWWGIGLNLNCKPAPFHFVSFKCNWIFLY